MIKFLVKIRFHIELWEDLFSSSECGIEEKETNNGEKENVEENRTNNEDDSKQKDVTEKSEKNKGYLFTM